MLLYPLEEQFDLHTSSSSERSVGQNRCSGRTGRDRFDRFRAAYMSAPGRSRDFAVTNKRVMMKVSVFNSRSVELLLNKIEAIAVNQSLVGRMFGYGDIEVTGSGGTEEEFANIQAPLELRRAVQSVTDAQTRPPLAKEVVVPQ
jgi:hypothetical protein